MTIRLYINDAATAQTPEALGIAAFNLSLLSMETDQLRLSTERSLGQAPLVYNDKIRLVRLVGTTETTLFVGRVASIRAAADAVNHAHDIVVLGPWHQLEQIVYKQYHWLYDSVQGKKVQDYASRVILSRKSVSVQAMIQEIITYATDQGKAEMQSSVTFQSSIATALPKDEQEGLTCAGAIRRLLRFFPDCTATFDYTSGIPQLIIGKKSSTTSLAACKTAALNLLPLYDRKIDRVEIEVYKTHSVDGKTYDTISRKRYPTDAATWVSTHPAINTLSVPLEMAGRDITYERARIESLDLPQGLGNEGDPTTAVKNWLKMRIEDITENIFDWPSGVTVEYKTKRFLRFNDAGVPLYEEKSGTAAMTQFDKEALTSIPHWVDTTAEATITVTFPKKVESREIGGQRYDIGETENEVYTLNLTVCSKASGDYRRVSSSIAEEDCPDALPQALYNAWKHTFIEGELTVWLEADTALPKVGDVITGYPGEVADTLALVQGITLDNSDQVNLTLGPPEHLSPHDLVELLRGFRTRRPVYHANDPDTGEYTGDYRETGSSPTHRSSGKSAALQTKANIFGASDKSKQVKIDPDTITGDKKEALFREVTLLAYNASTKKLQPTKAFVLATEPVKDGNEVDITPEQQAVELPNKDLIDGTTKTGAITLTAPSGLGTSSAKNGEIKFTLPTYNLSTKTAGTAVVFSATGDVVNALFEKGDANPDKAYLNGASGTFTLSGTKLTLTIPTHNPATGVTGSFTKEVDLASLKGSDLGTLQSCDVITGVAFTTSGGLVFTKKTIKYYGNAPASATGLTVGVVSHSSQHA